MDTVKKINNYIEKQTNQFRKTDEELNQDMERVKNSIYHFDTDKKRRRARNKNLDSSLKNIRLNSLFQKAKKLKKKRSKSKNSFQLQNAKSMSLTNMNPKYSTEDHLNSKSKRLKTSESQYVKMNQSALSKIKVKKQNPNNRTQKKPSSPLLHQVKKKTVNSRLSITLKQLYPESNSKKAKKNLDANPNSFFKLKKYISIASPATKKKPVKPQLKVTKSKKPLLPFSLEKAFDDVKAPTSKAKNENITISPRKGENKDSKSKGKPLPSIVVYPPSKKTLNYINQNLPMSINSIKTGKSDSFTNESKYQKYTLFQDTSLKNIMNENDKHSPLHISQSIISRGKGKSRNTPRRTEPDSKDILQKSETIQPQESSHKSEKSQSYPSQKANSVKSIEQAEQEFLKLMNSHKQSNKVSRNEHSPSSNDLSSGIEGVDFITNKKSPFERKTKKDPTITELVEKPLPLPSAFKNRRNLAQKYLFDSPEIIRETTLENKTSEYSPVVLKTKRDSLKVNDFNIALAKAKESKFSPRKTENDSQNEQMNEPIQETVKSYSNENNFPDFNFANDSNLKSSKDKNLQDKSHLSNSVNNKIIKSKSVRFSFFKTEERNAHNFQSIQKALGRSSQHHSEKNIAKPQQKSIHFIPGKLSYKDHQNESFSNNKSSSILSLTPKNLKKNSKIIQLNKIYKEDLNKNKSNSNNEEGGKSPQMKTLKSLSLQPSMKSIKKFSTTKKSDANREEATLKPNQFKVKRKTSRQSSLTSMRSVAFKRKYFLEDQDVYHPKEFEDEDVDYFSAFNKLEDKTYDFSKDDDLKSRVSLHSYAPSFMTNTPNKELVSFSEVRDKNNPYSDYFNLYTIETPRTQFLEIGHFDTRILDQYCKYSTVREVNPKEVQGLHAIQACVCELGILSLKPTLLLKSGELKICSIIGNQSPEKIKPMVKDFQEYSWTAKQSDKIIHGFTGWGNGIILFFKLTTIQQNPLNIGMDYYEKDIENYHVDNQELIFKKQDKILGINALFKSKGFNSLTLLRVLRFNLFFQK